MSAPQSTLPHRGTAVPAPGALPHTAVLRRWTVRLLHHVSGLGGVALVLVALDLSSRSGLVSGAFLPTVPAIGRALLAELGSAGYWTAVLHTLQGWALGLAVAVVIAVPLGLLLGYSGLAYHALRPVIEFLRPIPSVALVPLAILIYGTGLSSKVFLAAFAAVWPLLVQTTYGVRDVDRVQLQTARSYRIRRRDRILRILIPSALPYVATGVRIASSVALILVVTAEIVIGAPGLGKEINDAQSGGAVAAMYALIGTAGLLGWGMNVGFTALEARALHWHPAHRRVAA